MTHLAPLYLLSELSERELTELYVQFVKNDDQIAVANRSSGFSLPMSVLFDGLVLSTDVLVPNIDFDGHKKIFNNLDIANIKSMLAVDLGENLKGGETIAPIMKGLLSFSRRAGTAISAAALYWRPANIISGFGYFDEAIKSYEQNGPFPILSLIDLIQQDDNVIISKGLSFLSTQEVQLSSTDTNTSDAVRNILMIINEIAVNGPITENRDLRAQFNDPSLALEISSTGQKVIARVTSKMNQ